MKLLVDPEIFFYGRCGMVRYYSDLFRQLSTIGYEIEIPLISSNSDFISGRFQNIKKITSVLPGNTFQNRINNLSKRWYYKEIKEDNYDLLFITSPIFEDAFLKYLPLHKPFVMVVHDTMRCVLGPDGLFDTSGSNADRLAYLARRASKVICISKKTQEDIIQLANIDKNRTTVIYTGNLLDITKEKKPNDIIPENFLLFVGDRTGRKNFRFFISSIASTLLQNEELFLICTGKSTIWEIDFIESLGIEKKVLFIEASDAILVNLYKHARALIYPSLYEGYGLPVLEGMSLGCPVITATGGGAIQEIGGNAVYYINPYDKKSILSGVTEILENPQQINLLKEKGLNQARHFTLEKMINAFHQELTKVNALK